MAEEKEKSGTSDVKQEDIADIMNRINDALEGTDYIATCYDNTGPFLEIVIDRKWI